MFGSTGVRIPRIVLGLGSRFCHMDSDQEAFDMLNFALDNGFYYWDTAHTYDNTIARPPWKEKPTELVISEVRVGEVVKTRRKEIFLSTKVQAREPAEAMKQIELSLKRLQTDRLDMLKIHSVDSMDDVNRMSEKGGLIDIVTRMKEEKVTRFIGFSCHIDSEFTVEMCKRAPFDDMLIAMNHYTPRANHLGIAWPAVKEKKMGLLLMKSVRPKETIEGLHATDLVRYALSLDGPDALALGMDSMDVVKSNLEILRNFQKLSPERMQQLALQLAPFYRHENLKKKKKGYTDGNWSCKA
jgi:aryl-alcohol dehydrogenase-like predicted oxidoreductase